jgi:hypothetical protein
LVEVIKTTQRGYDSQFIPRAYDPTLQDIRFVGSMGVLGTIGWYASLYGSLACVAFAIFAFQSGKPGLRNRSFYQTRLVFYSTVMLIAAASQVLLGAYVMKEYGTGPLPNGPIIVSMYVVLYPEVNLACGCVMVATALFGFARAAGVSAVPDNHMFQAMAWFSWLVNVGGVAMFQIYALPEGVGIGRAPSLVMLMVGMFVLPAFLDYKMRTLPLKFPEGYYATPHFANKPTEVGAVEILPGDADSEASEEMSQ